MLAFSEPPGNRHTVEIKRPKLDAFVDQIDQLLAVLSSRRTSLGWICRTVMRAYLGAGLVGWPRAYLRGHKISIGERLQADLAALQNSPFEACDLRSG